MYRYSLQLPTVYIHLYKDLYFSQPLCFVMDVFSSSCLQCICRLAVLLSSCCFFSHNSGVYTPEPWKWLPFLSLTDRIFNTSIFLSFLFILSSFPSFIDFFAFLLVLLSFFLPIFFFVCFCFFSFSVYFMRISF